MGLYDRFELLELRRDDGIQTFHAREISTARPVQVHLFVRGTSRENEVLLRRLDHLPDAEWRRILDRGELDGMPYVVTDRLAGYPGFREWVAEKSDPAPRNSALDQQFHELFETAETADLTGVTARPGPAAPALAPRAEIHASLPPQLLPQTPVQAQLSSAPAPSPALASAPLQTTYFSTQPTVSDAPVFVGPAAFLPAEPGIALGIDIGGLEPRADAPSPGAKPKTRAVNAVLGIVVGILAAIALLALIIAAMAFHPR